MGSEIVIGSILVIGFLVLRAAAKRLMRMGSHENENRKSRSGS